MPIEISPPVLTPADLANEPYKESSQSIGDAYALSLVNQDFWAYSTYRTQNHDRRWNTHDSLYVGYVPQRVWDGSTIPRSAFTQQVVFDQVESALPAIYNSIFGIGPEWFQVQAEPGTQPEEAIQQRDTLSYTLEHPRDDLGSNAIREFKLAFKDILLHGNGGVVTEWDAVLQRPIIEWVDIRDLYIDPGLSTPSLDESRSVIRRKFMTIDEILSLRSDSRMNIPSSNILYYMAKNVPQESAEQTKRVQEALRGVYFSPGFSDYAVLPSDQKVEVLIYYSKTRIIWVLNKQWIAYNQPNPYGFIPFSFAPCYIYPSRFYAQSIADMQEQNQRTIEALINAHYDELTLNLHPPRVMNRKSFLTPAQQRWRPGAVFSGDSKDDVSMLQVGNNTVNVFDDIQYLMQVAEKRTGIGFNTGGSVPSPSNANRTKGGLEMQAGGSSNRLSDIVENIENYLIIPALYKLQKLLQFHTRPGQALPAAGAQGQRYQVNASVVQKPVRFRMLAASRMVTKDKLMQIFPFWMQAIAQGGLLEQLSKTGKTINFDELFRMLQDATGVGQLYNLIRPLNQQEQQSMQQPPPQVQAAMQKSQQELSTRKELMQMKVQGELQKEQIKQQPKPPDPAAMQVKQQEAQMAQQQQQQEMAVQQQASQQDMQMKGLMAQLAIHAKQEHHKLDLQKKQADIGMSMQKAKMDQMATLQKAQLDAAVAAQQAQQQSGIQQQQAAQDQQQAGTEHQMKMHQMAETLKQQAEAARQTRIKKTAEIRHKAKPPGA